MFQIPESPRSATPRGNMRRAGASCARGHWAVLNRTDEMIDLDKILFAIDRAEP